VLSPFRPERWTVCEVLCDLPIFGFLIRKLWRTSGSAASFDERAYAAR